jgi:hypothetical protein
MHNFIASFLFQNNYCPLPGIGTLVLNQQSAESDFAGKKIYPPKSTIRFSAETADAAVLVAFIKNEKNISTEEAAAVLQNFSTEISNKLSVDKTMELHNIGTLQNNNDTISFTEKALPDFFVQPVIAERVIHPQAEHSILVGEKETTNTAMTEYYADEPVAKDRWWIWAIVLGTIAVAVITYHFTSNNFSLGNQIKVLTTE